MAKTKLQMQDISDVLAAAIEPFQVPPLVAAPNTSITDLSGNPRKLSDPSKTIRPLLGYETIYTKSIKLIKTEKGPNGEPVYGIENDDRIRFVGLGWYAETETNGSQILSTSLNDYVEITFYGIGANLLTLIDATSRDYRASLNGVEGGSSVYTAGANILNGRNYKHNQQIQLYNAQPLQLHTVKVRLHSGANIRVEGFQIHNDPASIKIPQGKIFNGGKGLTLNSLQTLAHSSDFAIGTPNGRGGRVVIYSQGNQLKKAIQPTDASAAYLGAANHSNEELILKDNFRTYGALRSDDFSAESAGLDDNAFTKENGTDTLVGNQVNVASGSTGIWPGTSNASFIRTFTGTGIDFVRSDTTGTIDSHDFYIDGNLVGNITGGAGVNSERIQKVASGLPYGDHTLRVVRVSAVSAAIGASDFLVYGPKKPTLPEDAIEIEEYYLPATYSGANCTLTTTLGNVQFPQGTNTKYSNRGFAYYGTWSYSGVAGVAQYLPHYPFSTTGDDTDYFEYTFNGTGFVYWQAASGSGNCNFRVRIDGATNATGVALQNMINNGSGNYATTTSTTNAPCRLQFTGLSAGKHTVRISRLSSGAAGFNPVALHIIPITHYPHEKLETMAMGPGVQVKRTAEENNVDLSKAKAWLVYDKASNQIRSSQNIAAVLSTGTGAFRVYFETPFKTKNYVFCGNVTKVSGTDTLILVGVDEDTAYRTPQSTAFEIRNTGALFQDRVCTIAFFGELEGEGD